MGVSVLQSAASAVLAPSLRHVADVLALSWTKRLTAAVHARYLTGNVFYSVANLAGMQASKFPRFQFYIIAYHCSSQWLFIASLAIRIALLLA